VSLTFHSALRKLNIESSIGASHQVLVHLKPLWKMNRNLVGSIYGMASIKIAHFAPIRLQKWLPQANLVSGWLVSKNLHLSFCFEET
jgi:hypothetical protein